MCLFVQLYCSIANIGEVIWKTNFAYEFLFFLLQLGILATYSRDELLVLYCYFRSLAVDSPFTMARENLVIAFDKVIFAPFLKYLNNILKKKTFICAPFNLKATFQFQKKNVCCILYKA
jgi:Est1 DNA/RNA binding domain